MTLQDTDSITARVDLERSDCESKVGGSATQSPRHIEDENPAKLTSFSATTLSQSSDDSNARQVKAANEEVDRFLADGFSPLLDWIGPLMKEEADRGGQCLFITCNHSSRVLDAAGFRWYEHAATSMQVPCQKLPFTAPARLFGLQIERLAAALADHFSKLMFKVQVTRTPERYVRHTSIPAETKIFISWRTKAGFEAEMAEVRRTALQTPRSVAACSSITSSKACVSTNGQPSYQTAPLVEYDRTLQRLAASLFKSIKSRVQNKAKEYKGSYSISSARGSRTAAKIIIYQEGLGKINGDWPCLTDGVYVLVRPVSLKNPAFRGKTELHKLINPSGTIGIAPCHSERFCYFLLPDDNEKEQAADIIAACSRMP